MERREIWEAVLPRLKHSTAPYFPLAVRLHLHREQRAPLHARLEVCAFHPEYPPVQELSRELALAAQRAGTDLGARDVRAVSRVQLGLSTAHQMTLLEPVPLILCAFPLAFLHPVHSSFCPLRNHSLRVVPSSYVSFATLFHLYLASSATSPL